jgi:hypothetical protein
MIGSTARPVAMPGTHFPGKPLCISCKAFPAALDPFHLPARNKMPTSPARSSAMRGGVSAGVVDCYVNGRKDTTGLPLCGDTGPSAYRRILVRIQGIPMNSVRIPAT